MDKRTFLKNSSVLGLASFAPFSVDQWIAQHHNIAPERLAQDDSFWKTIRDSYKLKPDYINLENGYYCFIPEETLEKYIQHIRDVNFQGSYYMRTVQWDNKKKVANQLAEMADCEPDELIITRNTTESLDMIIGGLDWKAGDEAIMADQDYGAMLDMFEQVADRYGVVNKRVSVPNHPKSDEEIVDLYASAITDKTKLLMVCHIINITGHILPIRKICDMAHARGVEVMVDGAHAFGHFQFSMKDLDCDYYGTSLHKWLSAPLGAGFLFVRKEKVPNVWPLFAEYGKEKEDILRLNHTGTHPVATDLAIANAIDYHNKIGGERKEARLRYLQTYWTQKARKVKGVVVNTPDNSARHCGIGNVGIETMKPSDLAKRLLDDYKIWTVAIDYANVKGCRISPNVYTTTEELDVLIGALGELA